MSHYTNLIKKNKSLISTRDLQKRKQVQIPDYIIYRKQDISLSEIIVVVIKESRTIHVYGQEGSIDAMKL